MEKVTGRGKNGSEAPAKGLDLAHEALGPACNHRVRSRAGVSDQVLGVLLVPDGPFLRKWRGASVFLRWLA